MTDDWLNEYTPFGALKTAEQDVQFGLDPSRGLTRERYQWYSNGTRFDSSHFTDGDGEINIETSASSGDVARLHSGLAGQYVSQALAKPGLKVYVDPSDVEVDSDGYVSMVSGEVTFGPIFWNGTGVETGFGVRINESGMYAIWKDGGNHKGNSPVHQSDWKSDPLNGDGESGMLYDPSDGYVFNFPYTWYNNGKLGIAILDPVDDELVAAHSFNPSKEGDGRASLRKPNLPIQIVVDNDGTADPISAALGGMQYTLYGAQSSAETRDTYVAEKNYSVDTQSNTPIDPIAVPGSPVYAVKRDPQFDTVELSLDDISISPDGDIFLYVWDIYDTSALTGASFENPITNYDTEARSLVDTSASALDTTNAVFRKVFMVESGGGSKVQLTSSDIDERIPLNATRVVTAVGKSSSNLSFDYTARNIEGF